MPNVPRVSHGLEVSGPTSRRPANAEIGDFFYDTTTASLLVFSGVGGWVATGGGSGGGGLTVGSWIVGSQIANARTISFVVSNSLGIATDGPDIYAYLSDSAGVQFAAADLPQPGSVVLVAGTVLYPDGFTTLGHVKPNGSGVFSVTISKGETASTYYLAVRSGSTISLSPAIALS